MNNFLFFTPPIVAAVAMPLWMAHCRKRDRRGVRRHWILYWIASLAPVGLHIGLTNIGPINENLNLFLTMFARLGVAAFAGGAIYLLTPIIRSLVNTALLSVRMTDAVANNTAVVRNRSMQSDDEAIETMTPASKGIYLAHSGVYRNDWYIYDEDDSV